MTRSSGAGSSTSAYSKLLLKCRNVRTSKRVFMKGCFQPASCALQLHLIKCSTVVLQLLVCTRSFELFLKLPHSHLCRGAVWVEKGLSQHMSRDGQNAVVRASFQRWIQLFTLRVSFFRHNRPPRAPRVHILAWL